MKKLIISSLILIVFVGIIISIAIFKSRPDTLNTGAPCNLSAQTRLMEMTKDGYKPQNITIKRCTKVVFKNTDTEPRWPASDLHPTHGIYPEFDPQQPVEVGHEWSFVFGKVGHWRYHDHLYPFVRGTITVTQ